MNIEMIWNKLNAIHDEVHQNAVDIAIVKTDLTNHLEHQNKITNQKIIIFGIVIAAVVGLVTAFV